MMEDGEDTEILADGTTSKRACDSCRSRKIRCDRVVPCSNCKASKLNCTTTAPAQKAQRQRVHISEVYEKKIDRIEDRLAGIEHVLASLAIKLNELDVRRDDCSQSRSSRTGTGPSPRAAPEAAATPAPFEGESTINRQSSHARELLAHIVDSNPSVGQNAEVKAALNALSELVNRQVHVPTPTLAGTVPLINRSLAEMDPETLPKPPWNVVSLVLEKASQFPTMAYAVVFPFLKMQNLTEIFTDAYSNPRACGASRRMLVYGVLHSMFSEFHTFPLLGMDPQAFRLYASQSKFQIEVAMSQLDIFMPASYENIMALLLGAACTVEMCKPSACYVMITVAAGLCQNLGYHRYQTMKDDSADVRKSKIHMFWMIYMFDKTMSLRMGRASVIQDWDISLPFLSEEIGPDHTNTAAGRDGAAMLAYWVKVARIQGLAYEKLFSAAAFLRSPEERKHTVVELVNGLNQAWYERGAVTATDLPGFSEIRGQHASASPVSSLPINASPNETDPPSKRRQNAQALFRTMPYISDERQRALDRVQDVFFYADVVVHYSVCALIQRAVSPDNVTFNPECLDSARAALVAHGRCNSQFNTEGNEELWTGYVHWTILQAPFTPFIVLFCNAVQTSDSTDIDSLSDFVKSLESSRTFSEGADNLYKMCQLFLTVAKLYLQSKAQDAANQSQSFPATQANFYTTADGTQLDLTSMSEFDPYLSALGFMPNSAWPIASYPGAPTPGGVDAYSQASATAGVANLDSTGIGMPKSTQNALQDWYSGSRYLIGLMEAGDDSQMPDFDF